MNQKIHYATNIHSREGAVFLLARLFTVVMRLSRADCKHTAMAAERGGGDNNGNDEMGNQLQLLPGMCSYLFPIKHGAIEKSKAWHLNVPLKTCREIFTDIFRSAAVAVHGCMTDDRSFLQTESVCVHLLYKTQSVCKDIFVARLKGAVAKMDATTFLSQVCTHFVVLLCCQQTFVNIFIALCT